MVRLVKFDEIRIFFFCSQWEVMMNSLCAYQCRESFQNVIVPSLGPSRIDFVTQWRLDTALSECSTSHYSTVHRDDFEGKSSWIPKFGDCSIDSGVPATHIIAERSCEALGNNKTTPVSPFWSQNVWNTYFQAVSRKCVWFCWETLWFVWSAEWTVGELVGDRDTGAIKYLYCDAKNVFDWVGEVSSRLQPPSQSQTLSRKKISANFESNHW